MKKYILFTAILAIFFSGRLEAQILTGFGSGGVNPLNATNLIAPWTGVIDSNLLTVTSVSATGGGIQQIFATPITVTNPIQLLTLTGTLVTPPANTQTFDIRLYDSTLLDTRTYQFSWTEFNTTTGNPFTGQLLTALNQGTFNGSVGAWELIPGGNFNDTVSFKFDNLAITATGVPEPSTYAMLAVGGVMLFFWQRRRIAVRA